MSDRAPTYVTTGELDSKLSAFRWEVRFLLALQTSATVVLLYKLGIQPVPDAVNTALGLVGLS